MERILSNFLRFVAGRNEAYNDMPLNRIARGDSHDRSLAAFKADQARIAGRQEGGTFASKRASTGG